MRVVQELSGLFPNVFIKKSFTQWPRRRLVSHRLHAGRGGRWRRGRSDVFRSLWRDESFLQTTTVETGEEVIWINRLSTNNERLPVTVLENMKLYVHFFVGTLEFMVVALNLLRHLPRITTCVLPRNTRRGNIPLDAKHTTQKYVSHPRLKSLVGHHEGTTCDRCVKHAFTGQGRRIWTPIFMLAGVVIKDQGLVQKSCWWF